jgi:hypothetical protein
MLNWWFGITLRVIPMITFVCLTTTTFPKGTRHLSSWDMTATMSGPRIDAIRSVAVIVA